MLLFKRRIGETIMIGDFMQCTVLGLKGDQIRLGFSCIFDDLPIQTEEEFRLIQEKDECPNIEINAPNNLIIYNKHKNLEECCIRKSK